MKNIHDKVDLNFSIYSDDCDCQASSSSYVENNYSCIHSCFSRDRCYLSANISGRQINYRECWTIVDDNEFSFSLTFILPDDRQRCCVTEWKWVDRKLHEVCALMGMGYVEAFKSSVFPKRAYSLQQNCNYLLFKLFWGLRFKNTMDHLLICVFRRFSTTENIPKNHSIVFWKIIK